MPCRLAAPRLALAYRAEGAHNTHSEACHRCLAGTRSPPPPLPLLPAALGFRLTPSVAASQRPANVSVAAGRCSTAADCQNNTFCDLTNLTQSCSCNLTSATPVRGTCLAPGVHAGLRMLLRCVLRKQTCRQVLLDHGCRCRLSRRAAACCCLQDQCTPWGQCVSFCSLPAVQAEVARSELLYRRCSSQDDCTAGEACVQPSFACTVGGGLRVQAGLQQLCTGCHATPSDHPTCWFVACTPDRCMLCGRCLQVRTCSPTTGPALVPCGSICQPSELNMVSANISSDGRSLQVWTCLRFSSAGSLLLHGCAEHMCWQPVTAVLVTSLPLLPPFKRWRSTRRRRPCRCPAAASSTLPPASGWAACPSARPVAAHSPCS